MVIFNDGILSSVNKGSFYGAVENIPNKIYHSLNHYYSSTQLKYLTEKSSLHFKAKYIDKIMPDKEPSYDMILGSLVHTMFLSPQDLPIEFFELPELNLRTKEGKATRDQIQIDHKDKTLVTSEMMTEAYKISEALRQNKILKKYKTKNELAFFWKCPFTQLNFRAKIDGMTDNILFELKTTSSGKQETFQRHIHNMNYDLQMAHYLEGIRHCIGPINEVIMIAADTDQPYNIQPYQLTDDFLELGHRKWLDAIQKLERGINQNHWESYYYSNEDIPLMSPPKWAIKGDENV